LNENQSVKEIIENGMVNKGKIRILRALAEDNKILTIYPIHKKTTIKR
jgi:hypothetical protein